MYFTRCMTRYFPAYIFPMYLQFMLFPQNKDTTLHSHPEEYFEHRVWVRCLVSVKVAVIVSTLLNKTCIYWLYFANLVMTLTFITVLHRFLNFEAEESGGMVIGIMCCNSKKNSPLDM